MYSIFRFALPARLTLITLLAACGGGGGGDAPVGVTPPVVTSPAVTVTYTATAMCASGPALTSTVSQVAADALVPNACPALPATAYAATTVVAGSGTLSLTVTGLPAGFVNGVLTATGLASGGTWDVVATAAGITVTPRAGAATDWATSYSGTLVMNFAGAPSASKTITFTTPAAPVTFAWTASVKTLVEPANVNGVLVSSNLAVTTWLALNPVEVSQNTTIIGGAKWNANLANDNVQIVKSGEMAPDINGVQRNIWRAVYSYVNCNGRVNCISPIYADTGLSYVNDNAVGTTCFLGDAPAYVVGVSDAVPEKNGMIFRVASGPAANSCFLLTVKSTLDVNCLL
jgi:hypothetical protein